MTATAEFLSERSEILAGGSLVPGVGAEGNFGADDGSADADGINALRVKQVGNEFVVTLKVQVADVEKDDAVAGLGALLENFDGFAVAFEKRLKSRC